MTDLTALGYYVDGVQVYGTPKEWEDKISALSEGETIQIPCMGGIYTFRVVGKGQDILANGKQDNNLASLICEELYAGSAFKMNFTRTNEGGWFTSAGREFVSFLLSTFPQSLQTAIKTVVKTSAKGNLSSDIVSSYNKLWIPSVSELCGTVDTFSNEGEQYNYYKNAQVTAKDNYSLLAKKTPGSSSPNSEGYWLRSPRSSNNSGFCRIEDSGLPVDAFADYAKYACVGFCI